MNRSTLGAAVTIAISLSETLREPNIHDIPRASQIDNREFSTPIAIDGIRKEF